MTEQHTAQDQAATSEAEQQTAHSDDHSHAAMCIYCGETVIYDTRQVTDMEAAHRQLVEHDQQCPKNPLAEERDRFSRLFATACETLGAVQEVLGTEDDPATIGLEPELVRELKEERDSLAAHVEALVVWADAYVGSTGLYQEIESARNADTTSLARRDAEQRKEGAISALVQAAVEMRESNDRESVSTVYALADHLEECARSIRRQAEQAGEAPE